MGEVFILETLNGDVPSKVKEGGWEGYESKRIERHIASHLRDFFKEVSKKTSDLFKKHKFDWLFLGCKDEHCSIFESLLHPYLEKRLKGRLKIGPASPPGQVLQASLERIKELKIQEKERLLEAFFSELEKGGLSDSGLKNSLRRLNRGQVQTLLITRYFSKQGKICTRCGFLYADETECPSCRIKTEDRIDIIDDAVESALEKNAEVRHINPPSKLARFGDIGVLLRYKS
jgi:peptide subunit release factor 1 (eRF1)